MRPSFRKIGDNRGGIALMAGLLMVVMLAPAMLAGCGSEDSGTAVKTRPVEVVVLKSTEEPVELRYIGMLSADQVQSYAFKSSGKIAAVHVSKGQHVEAGELLVSLDSKDIGYAVDATRAQADAAQANYDKAVNGATPEEIRIALLGMEKAASAFNMAQADYERCQALYTAGAISKQQLEQGELNRNISEAEYNQATEGYNQLVNGAREEDLRALAAQSAMAEAEYNARASLLDDCQMRSTVNGYVVDVLQDEGEFVAAGYPVAVVRTEIQTVETGLSQKDTAVITASSRARVVKDSFETSAVIAEIAQVPDQDSGTYKIKLILNQRIPENLFFLGTTVDVYLGAGMSRGIWIPVACVLNDGEDYVYVVKEDRAVRKNIILGSVSGSQVVADGLAEGESLVVQGMKNLDNGSAVTLVESKDGQ